MKFKKVLTVLFTSVMVLTMSSSVMAESTEATEVTPFIIGVGDTRDTAINLIPSQNYSLFLSNDNNDKDWFKWTNNTNQYKRVSSNVYFNGSRLNYRFGFIIDYGNGKETNLVYDDPDISGDLMSLDNLYLPPGATLYLVLRHAPGRDIATQYTIVWYLQDI
ncbi:hypothetical protein D3C74_140260 [compost metagenome]